MIRKKTHRFRGFTLIEILIVFAILAVFILAALWAYRVQLLKGRDGRRKADLAKVQRVLEDYLNDNICYPETLKCNNDFLPYLSSVPCDPINAGNKIYYYSVSQDANCKKWYKIFTTLEYDKDPIIKKINCTLETCGPFNYVVSSPNVESLKRQLGEIYPPAPSGVPLPTVTPPLGGGSTSTPTPTGGAIPTPTPTSGIPTPTPTCSVGWFTCIGQGGTCNVSYEGAPGAVCSSTCNDCTSEGCDTGC